MKKKSLLSKITTFAAGMMTMAVLITVVIPASASGNQVAYNQVGIRTFGTQRIAAGEHYTAPNGQQVPSSITYTDATGGKTNYLSVRQIAELLDATIGWNAETNSVDIAAPGVGGNVEIAVGKDTEEPDIVRKPEYGKIIGGVEEIDPSTVPLINNTAYRSRSCARDLRMQFSLSEFPGFTVDLDPTAGPYMVFTVTNNGDREIYSSVRRDVTVSYGKHQDFTDVAVLPGETLVRLFRVVDDPHPLQTKLNFNVRTNLDRDHPDNDVTVSLMQYYDSLDYLNE